MIDRQEMAERHSRHLAELAELGMAVARDLGTATLQADVAQKAELGLAFQRAARSVRQTLALEARLARDVARVEEAARKHADQALKAKVSLKQARIGAVIEREIWAEYEEDDANEKLDAFSDLLNELTLEDGFLDIDVEAQIARVAAVGVDPQHRVAPSHLR